MLPRVRYRSPVLMTALFMITWPTLGVSAEVAPREAGLQALRQGLPLMTVLPFLLLLLAIAVLPLIAAHWWEHNRNKTLVAVVLAAPVTLYLTTVWGAAGSEVLLEKLEEYVSFIILLAALYVISGGIYVQGSLSGTPLANTGLLALGTLLANVIGTTGASVLLVRPLLRANASREDKTHVVVFFIFVVSNCAGLLTPLGDPPLFLGFLKGVPFEWTLQLWPQWLMVNLALLVIFNVWDQVVLSREEKRRPGSQWEQVMIHEPLRIQGMLNVLFLIGIVATIFASGRGLGNHGQAWPFGVQEALMALLGITAFVTTSGENHTKNRFTFGPMVEVAVLFAGIFVTMAPALAILNAWGQGQRAVLGLNFGLSEPWHFFWATGLLSSFLDNAPTYLTFSVTACGLQGIPAEGRFLGVFLQHGPEAFRVLAAIACGAVMMGANTYIGNGPNFMVKAIAEENGVRMPSFFGYMLYSGGILIPLFVVVTLIFFRG